MNDAETLILDAVKESTHTLTSQIDSLRDSVDKIHIDLNNNTNDIDHLKEKFHSINKSVESHKVIIFNVENSVNRVSELLEKKKNRWLNFKICTVPILFGFIGSVAAIVETMKWLSFLK